MNTIQIFCKANKRNRNGKLVSVCGHIIKENENYTEDAYVVESEGNGILLELMALMNALLDKEEQLNKDILLEVYVCNEYIYKTLKNREEDKSALIAEEKYANLWQEINELINQCNGVRCYSTEKKYRDESNEEVVKCMAQLNRLVCEKINSSGRE